MQSEHPACLAPSTEYEQRCREALDSALQSVPAYAAWRAFDPGPARPFRERYAALPVLTKADVRRHYPHGFLAPDCDREAGLRAGDVQIVTTSGATEDAVPIHWNQSWWNASERASWRLNAHTARANLGNHREAILSSPLCVGRLCDDGALPMEQRREQRFLFLTERLNPAQWPESLLERMVVELNAFQPVTLEANPAFLARLARHIAGRGATVYQPAAIILTYEFPSRLYLRQIRRAFTAPTCSSYGSTEAGYVFMECEAGRLHQNCETCHVDFQPLKPEHGGPRVGRILVTTFGNPWFRVVRFNVNDLVRLADEPCPCGRDEGLTLAAVEGRLRDVTLSADGRAVTVNQVDEALAAIDSLVGYQVEQTGRAAYRLRLAFVVRPSGRTVRAATDALRQLYGAAASIETQLVKAIEPEPYGKHRLTRCLVAVDYESLIALNHRHP